MRLRTLYEDITLRDQLPSAHRTAFDKALNWKPKLHSWKYSQNKAAKATAVGKKPMLTGYRQDILEKLAADYGLDIFGDMAFLPENKDIAEMVGWAEENLPAEDFHIIQGVALGYPIGDIEEWVDKWKSTRL